MLRALIALAELAAGYIHGNKPPLRDWSWGLDVTDDLTYGRGR